MRIYLDNASTTPLDPLVLEVMLPYLRDYYGNPSSIHFHGRKVRSQIEEARTLVAKLLNASTGEIFFTSSATEANNMVLFGTIRDRGVKRIISTGTEHHCVKDTLQYIARHKMASIEMLNVDSYGNINHDELVDKIKNSGENTLVSIMHANNETGTMSDLNAIAQICAETKCSFHSDTVQSMGKFPLDMQETQVDYLSGSAHKFYGPKGIGFLFMRQEKTFNRLIHGGGQERNMRAGTENVYGIIGLAKALELACSQIESRRDHILNLRNRMKAGLREISNDIAFLGNQDSHFHYGILNVSLPRNQKSEMIMMNLDIKGISASSGSACTSGIEYDSHVLEAMKVPMDRKSIRFSFSHLNTEQEIDFVLEKITDFFNS